jgi:periplasmic divalent cation tolerance protein
MTAILVLCTCPDEASGERLGATLVGEHLAACVNRLPNVVSIYRWQGKVQRDSEQLLIIKTTHERFDALRERIVSLHPYEVPEIVAVDVAAGLDRYLSWIEAETTLPT